jgi:hypothetical protein
MSVLGSQQQGTMGEHAPSVLPRRVSVRGGFAGSPAAFENCQRQREALAQMSECELITGKTAEQLRAIQQEQRARVLKRYGIQEAA